MIREILGPNGGYGGTKGSPTDNNLTRELLISVKGCMIALNLSLHNMDCLYLTVLIFQANKPYREETAPTRNLGSRRYGWPSERDTEASEVDRRQPWI